MRQEVIFQRFVLWTIAVVLLFLKGSQADVAVFAQEFPGKAEAATTPRLTDTVPPSANAPFDATKAKEHQEAWAKHLGRKVAEKNSIGLELRLIPPGSYQMGSPASDSGAYENEQPQVEVTLTKPIYLGKTEVTQGQWLAVMNKTPWKGKEHVQEGANYPATFVSWDDAQEFCQKLGQQDGQSYRLPTEAEWEFACRAGTMVRYGFGDGDSSLGKYAWYEKNAKDIGETYAHEVALKQPNAFGLHDMHGNVNEWCQDVYEKKLPGGTDPLVEKGGFTVRVNRSGSWDFIARFCRSAIRSGGTQNFRLHYSGFRVVQVPTSK